MSSVTLSHPRMAQPRRIDIIAQALSQPHWTSLDVTGRHWTTSRRQPTPANNTQPLHLPVRISERLKAAVPTTDSLRPRPPSIRPPCVAPPPPRTAARLCQVNPPLSKTFLVRINSSSGQPSHSSIERRHSTVMLLKVTAHPRPIT
ncbi:hypothetical protein NA56DRAFT_643273 [Hyaloscypha hepaticicola]|uniref:Uncharacterized protein n=1 Tax=Hyaloscypha hepaticicola TaxID=2082293 RepID=A0A2J6QCI8_9HELO|nr:hypothetical protein NA56DRAFT_643273 [Hyaloscypha hepaticicola]